MAKQFSWTGFGWTWSVRPGYALLVFCIVCLCLTLALWQWQRAQSAAARYLQYQQQLMQPSSPLTASSKNYQKVTTHAQIRQLFFLDNQIHQGKAGFFVIAEAETKAGLLLVSLGWQSRQSMRTTLSDLPQVLAIEGILVKPEPGLMLAAAVADPAWPETMQQIQIPLLNQHFGYQLLPFVLHAEVSPAPLATVPFRIKNKYPMHLGYVIQWLLIALVFLIGFVFVCRQRPCS